MRISLLLLIMLGSALGGGARFLLSGAIADWFGGQFPWGTFIVTVSGSFIIGFLAFVQLAAVLDWLTHRF